MESLPPETSARTEYICGIFKSRRKGVKERERDGEMIQSEEKGTKILRHGSFRRKIYTFAEKKMVLG